MTNLTVFERTMDHKPFYVSEIKGGKYYNYWKVVSCSDDCKKVNLLLIGSTDPSKKNVFKETGLKQVRISKNHIGMLEVTISRNEKAYTSIYY